MISNSYNGYTIRRSGERGGKAGRGKNKTATIQVLDGEFLLKQFKFEVGDDESFERARLKAINFVDSQSLKP